MVLVIKNSLSKWQKQWVLTWLGIWLGILVHVAYCIAGVALLISQSIVLFTAIKILWWIYLFSIAVSLLKSSKPPKIEDDSLPVIQNLEVVKSSKWNDFYRYIREWFLCNALNPKATLFYLALFTQIIDPSSSIAFKWGIWLLLAIITWWWFVLLAFLIGHRNIRKRIGKIQFYVEKIFWTLLIVLIIKLFFQ